MAEREYSIIIEHLSKVYKIYSKSWLRVLNAFSSKVPHKNFYAIKDLSVKFAKGETIGIIGRNGNGKSTLLKMITGITEPTTGTIETHGRIVAMLELTAGFDKELTGLENIYIKGRTIGLSKEEIEKRLPDIEKFAEIGDYITQPVRTYSSGMKSRLGFAVSIHLDPDILIVDEVLAVGDTSFKLKCLTKMEEFRLAGKTILFVSHNLTTVKAFCSSCMWIRNGEMAEYGETGKVVQDYQDYLKAERKAENERRRAENEDLILTKTDMLKPSKAIICNSDGDEKDMFEFGDDICISARYEVKVPTEMLTAGITIYDSEGKEVFGSDRQAGRFRLNTGEGKHDMFLTMKHPSLLPGHYTLTCEIWNPQSGFVKPIFKDRPFEIASDHFYGTGIMAIECWCESK